MPERESQSTPVTDPKAWLALAHPLRLRIAYELQLHQAARVTDLARALDVSPNSVSFHLRQLARFGYVEPDDAPRSDKRERWWRSTSPTGFRIEQTEQDADSAGKLLDVMRRRAHEQLDDWYDAVSVPDEEGSEPLRSSNYDLRLWLTPDQREEFLGQLGDVFATWMAVSRTAATTAATTAASTVPETAAASEYVLFGYGLPRSAYDAVRGRRVASSPPQTAEPTAGP